MDILVVCSEIPYPLNAGYKIRTFNLITRLSQDHSITLVCYERGSSDPAGTVAMRRFCDEINLITARSDSKIRQFFKIIANTFRGQPVRVKYVKSTAMETELACILKSKNFDIIHFDDPYLASNLNFDSYSSVKKTVTFHDIDSHKYRMVYNIEKGVYRKMMLSLNLLLLGRWENTLVNKSDLCIVVSDLDAAKLKGKRKVDNISVIPNGVDIHRFQFHQSTEMNDTISFFGTLDYSPNRDAVHFFYRQILPIIKQARSDAKFAIVGRNPGKDITEIANDPCVVLAANVEDVIPYYLKSAVAVVPLRAGGGTRLKILESMALGIPVVSTSVGCEGLDVIDRKNIMIADEPQEFANKVCELCTMPSLRDELSRSARKLVEDKYDWEPIARHLQEVYVEVLSRPRSRQ